MLDEDLLAHLKELNSKNQLVLFVGAGISHYAVHDHDPKLHLPMWSALAKKVAKDAGISSDEFEGDVLDLFDGVSIDRGRPFLDESVSRHLDDRLYRPSSLHAAIMSSGIGKIYTTNYDSLLTRSGISQTIITEKDYDRVTSMPNDRHIFQIHGTVHDPHTLTKADYRKWQNDRPRAKLKLTQLLSENAFLFVGYSLHDPHLTEVILPGVQAMLGTNKHPHYAWMWNLKERPKEVLLRRDGIQSMSIDSEAEWIDAFAAISVPREFDKDDRRLPGLAKARRPRRTDPSVAPINPYKLYYFRTARGKSVKDVAAAAGVTVSSYKSYERVSNVRSPPSVKLFKRVSRGTIIEIENYLRCPGELEVKNSADIRTQYIEYYIRKRSSRTYSDVEDHDYLNFDTKAIVFDFDGTLTVPDSNETTWETIWTTLGYDVSECTKYHSMYTSGRITHRRWCEITCERFRAKGLTRAMVDEISEKITLMPGVEDVVAAVRERGIPIFIVSGSVKQIIKKVLYLMALEFEQIAANSFHYDHEGLISDIESTRYDFEGKADFLRNLASDMGISPAEILFVGNSINDEFAAQAGVRTLCVNPSFTNPENRSQWNYAIRRMTDFKDVLRFANFPTAQA